MANLRIGYRHTGKSGSNTAANAVFADGHAETLNSSEFPCSFVVSTKTYSNNVTTRAQQDYINLHNATVYADPVAAETIVGP